MKRSGSKLLGKAGSIRNINKVGYKFNIKLHLESVDKVLSASEVFLSWERNDKVKVSKAVKVDREKRNVDFQGEILVQDVTFYKRKRDGSQFEDKVFRLALKQNSDKKSIGRIDINFAQYIDVPSLSKRLSAALTNGSEIIIRIESKFLREAKQKSSKKKDDDTSSMGSSQLDNESEFDSQDFGNEADAIFDDLSINDDLVKDSTPVSSSASSASQSQQQVGLGPLVPPSALSSTPSGAGSYHHQGPVASHAPSFSHQQSSSSAAGHHNNNGPVAGPVLSSLASGSAASSALASATTTTTTTSSSATTTAGIRQRPPLAPMASNTPGSDDILVAGVPVTPGVSHAGSGVGSAFASPSPGSNLRGRKPHDTSLDTITATATAGNNNNSGGKGKGLLNNGRFQRSGSNNNSNVMQLAEGKTYSKQEYEALQRENRQLRRRNDDYQTRISELEHRLENYSSMAAGHQAGRVDSISRVEIDDLTQENKSLKEHIDDLEMRIKREPIYADVVRDLREAKMALAIMNIERDELKQELRRLKKR